MMVIRLSDNGATQEPGCLGPLHVLPCKMLLLTAMCAHHQNSAFLDARRIARSLNVSMVMNAIIAYGFLFITTHRFWWLQTSQGPFLHPWQT